MVVCRFRESLGWRISPIFFSLVCHRAFREAPHSRFRCWHLKLCLLDLWKMLDLDLSQIYTLVLHLWKSIDLDSVWVWDSRPYQLFFCLVSSRWFRDSPHSRFTCRDPNQCLPNFSKMLLLALSQIYTRVFHLWKSIELDSACVRDSRLYHLFFSSKFSHV